MSLLERCRERRQHTEEDEGFTLIELLVVLLIIGILLAIAIPTFLSVTKGANGTTAQSNLQTALTGADAYFESANQSYAGAMDANNSAESNLTSMSLGVDFLTSATASKATNTISVDVAANGEYIILEDYAPGQNECWGILDVKAQGSAPTGFPSSTTATGTYYWKEAPGTGGCTAGSAAPATVSTTGFPS